MSRRLRQQGFAVTGWDRRNAATNQVLAADGLPIAADPRGVPAAAADIVILSITEDHGARKIFTGPAGFLDGAVTGKLFIEMRTLQPRTGRALAPRVEARGARLLEAPVLGTIPQVAAGTLFAMVGGRADDIERARGVLEKLTRRMVHMGPNGSGYAMKLAANLGLGAYIQAIAESLALGAQQGLALDLMVDVLQESATACGWLKAKADVLKGKSGDMTLDIRTLRKDIMSAVATGALTGVLITRLQPGRSRRCRRRSTATTAAATSPSCQSSFAKRCCRNSIARSCSDAKILPGGIRAHDLQKIRDITAPWRSGAGRNRARFARRAGRSVPAGRAGAQCQADRLLGAGRPASAASRSRSSTPRTTSGTSTPAIPSIRAGASSTSPILRILAT